MLEEPPPSSVGIVETAQADVIQVKPHLPTEKREDGSVVVDLSGLAPPPTDCLESESDPFNPEIVVCREITHSPRLGADYGPSAEEVTSGSAVPRASVRLSEDVEAEASVAKSGVGGWDADGVEAKVKIEF
ncbi:MAG: hypothetical protein AAGI28_07075 [Pseudomonadota bacterium]